MPCTRPIRVVAGIVGQMVYIMGHHIQFKRYLLLLILHTIVCQVDNFLTRLAHGSIEESKQAQGVHGDCARVCQTATF